MPPAAFGVKAPVNPLMLVAVAAPRLGVVNVGELIVAPVCRTTGPDPVTPFERFAAAGCAYEITPLLDTPFAN